MDCLEAIRIINEDGIRDFLADKAATEYYVGPRVQVDAETRFYRCGQPISGYEPFHGS
jgi:hypothetical protein